MTPVFISRLLTFGIPSTTTSGGVRLLGGFSPSVISRTSLHDASKLGEVQMQLAGDFGPHFAIHDEGRIVLINQDTTQINLL